MHLTIIKENFPFVCWCYIGRCQTHDLLRDTFRDGFKCSYLIVTQTPSEKSADKT